MEKVQGIGNEKAKIREAVMDVMEQKLQVQFAQQQSGAKAVKWWYSIVMFFLSCHKYTVHKTQRKTNILFVTSNRQTTNLVFPNFFHEFFSVWEDEKENKLFIGPKMRKKTCFGPIKSLFSFSTVQAEKNSWKKLGETKLVVWWFDVRNKIQSC